MMSTGITGFAKRTFLRMVLPKAKCAQAIVDRVRNRNGLEVGGPSFALSDAGILPIYRYVRSMDNCVFSSRTIWHANSGPFLYHPQKPAGHNFICEMTSMASIRDASYDFVVASHSLEHCANPIGALREYARVTKPSGTIVIILPHYGHTFDHRRELTSIAHMMDDYRSGTSEADKTHLQEILQLHDLQRDPEAGTPEQFRIRSENNFENRCLHHHTFDESNARPLMEAAGLRVDLTEFVRPYNLIVVSDKESS